VYLSLFFLIEDKVRPHSRLPVQVAKVWLMNWKRHRFPLFKSVNLQIQVNLTSGPSRVRVLDVSPDHVLCVLSMGPCGAHHASKKGLSFQLLISTFPVSAWLILWTEWCLRFVCSSFLPPASKQQRCMLCHQSMGPCGARHAPEII